MTVLIRSVDFETTDLKREDGAEVIEWGWTDMFFDPQTLDVEIRDPMSQFFGASQPLRPENMAIHHITDADIAGLPLCTDDDLRQLIDGADFVCAHNFAFEGQWLTPEIMGERYAICTMKAARQAWKSAPTFSNQGLRYFLGLKLHDGLAMPPHRAGPDSFVTAHILGAMLKTERVNDLVRWTREPMFYLTVPIGKHKGQPWSEVPADYLNWLIRQPDMEADIKAGATAEMTRRREHG